MAINPSAEHNSRLNNQIVETAKKGIAAQANQNVQRRNARRAWKKNAAQTQRWLHEIETKEAKPHMCALSKAEKVVGHRLVLMIDKDLMLSSRGFRISLPVIGYPMAGWPEFTTYRVKPSSLSFGGRLVAEGESIKSRVKVSLQDPEIEKRLLYLGLDEWSTTGKIAWWAAMLGTGMLGWWLVVHQVHCAAFRRAFVPVNAQTRQQLQGCS